MLEFCERPIKYFSPSSATAFNYKLCCRAACGIASGATAATGAAVREGEGEGEGEGVGDAAVPAEASELGGGLGSGLGGEWNRCAISAELVRCMPAGREVGSEAERGAERGIGCGVESGARLSPLTVCPQGRLLIDPVVLGCVLRDAAMDTTDDGSAWRARRMLSCHLGPSHPLAAPQNTCKNTPMPRA